MADLSDFKRGQIVGARMAGATMTIIWCSKEYCLESNDSFYERMKNLLKEAKH